MTQIEKATSTQVLFSMKYAVLKDKNKLYKLENQKCTRNEHNRYDLTRVSNALIVVSCFHLNWVRNVSEMGTK